MKKNPSPITLITALFFIAFFHFQLGAQDFTVVFYNTENLFDTIDDPAVKDEEFLPDARLPWTSERYEIKLEHLAQALSSICSPDLPAVIGLCEVENEQVLKDLVSQEALKKGNYGIVHFDSPDERGIDNALLYEKSEMKVLSQKAIPVRLGRSPEDATRDILYVKGVTKHSTGDTLHFFVNHWPSRYGGAEASEADRIDAARTLRAQVDSLFSLNQAANIIIMGDFNDEPDNSSLSDILGAKTPVADSQKLMLYNLMMVPFREGKGTIYYKDWDVFDQFVVSGNILLKNSGITLPDHQGRIFSADFLMFKPANGEARPNRTAGKDYYGGYSDHLPVYLNFKFAD